MNVQANFEQPAGFFNTTPDWQPLHQPGVEIHMLDHVSEAGWLTALLRYQPGSQPIDRSLPTGQEFVVIKGVYRDATGDYEPGSYGRNPPGRQVVPWPQDGCVLFVKLNPFDPLDREPVVRNPLLTIPDQRPSDDIEQWNLHRHGRDHARMMRIAPGGLLQLENFLGGTEVLMLSGSAVADGFGSLSGCSWLRLPAPHPLTLRARDEVVLWVKTGHLPTPKAAVQRSAPQHQSRRFA